MRIQLDGKEFTAEDVLMAVPMVNASAKINRGSRGGVLVEVPMRRPGWMIPPLTWIFPFSEARRLKLDVLGVTMLDLCDGKRTVEDVIEKFAVDNLLTFREAQLSIMDFLRKLSERGVLAIARFGKDSGT